MMQDGGTDRAPIDRGSGKFDRTRPTRPYAKNSRVKQLSLAIFDQQRTCSCFVHITWLAAIQLRQTLSYECVVCTTNVDLLGDL
jgi:hypothetical protein